MPLKVSDQIEIFEWREWNPESLKCDDFSSERRKGNGHKFKMLPGKRNSNNGDEEQNTEDGMRKSNPDASEQ